MYGEFNCQVSSAMNGNRKGILFASLSVLAMFTSGVYYIVQNMATRRDLKMAENEIRSDINRTEDNLTNHKNTRFTEVNSRLTQLNKTLLNVLIRDHDPRSLISF